MQDARTPEEEVVRALDELVREGKVVYFGASNYAAYRLVESLWAADRAGANRFVTLQAQYSLVERSLDLEHLPALRRFGMGLLAWSPLAGGFLSGKYRRDQAPPAGSRLAQERFRDRLAKRTHGAQLEDPRRRRSGRGVDGRVARARSRSPGC